jgi:hypothetical protein
MRGSPQTGTRPSVILIREWEQQMSSSGCCGRLEGDFLVQHGERCFLERRRRMEGVGRLYRAIQERLGDAVELHVVDPRNLPALLVLLARDFFRYRVPFAEIVATLGSVSVTAVVVHGRLRARETLPPASTLVDELSRPGPGKSTPCPPSPSPRT